MHPASPLRAARITPLAVALAMLAACGGNDRAMLSPPTPNVKVDVRASRSDAEMMVRTPSAERGARGGTTLQLDAAVFNPNGKELEHKQHIYWTSSDTMVATVDSTGLVTAEDTGDVFVVVDHKKGVDTVTIRVVPVPVASVAMTGPDSVSLDDTASFTATPLDSAGEALEGRTTHWSSLAPAVASVSEAGEVIALATGSTRIGAVIDGTSADLPLTVWPQPVASVEVTPATTSLAQFRRTSFTATAYDKRGKVLGDRAVTWSSSAPTVLTVDAATGAARALDVGTATAIATVEGKTGEAAVTVTNPVEARALWVTRFEYTTSSAVDFAKIATIFQKAASANFNVVYFQVRTSGDALYYSDIEPCSPRMCGTLGGPRPSRDPLAVALAEAAKYGIEVHAWINAYTGFIAASTAACNQFINSTPMNWLKAHPEWSQAARNNSTGLVERQVDKCTSTQLSSEYMYVSPGVPEVRSHLARVSADIARRYGPLGLKGIHLDRIRFANQPGTVSGVSYTRFSYDATTQAAFRAATGAFPTGDTQLSWQNFRRGLVNQGVKEVWDSVRAVNGAFVLSAAVWPGYQSRSGWSATWSYSDLFQDPQAWAQGGYLDVEVPMNYPATASSTSWTVKAYCSNTDWTCVMDDHINRIERQSGRQVYVGVGAIRGWAEMQAELDLAHDRAVTGMSVYSYSLVDAIPNGWAQLAAGPFKNKATIPAMGWKP